MEEETLEIRSVLKYLFIKGFDNKAILSELYSIYGSNCISLRTVQRRRKSYNEGTFSIYNENGGGRPAITEYDEQILEMLQDNPYLKTKEIAEHFKIHKNTVKVILEDHLHYHKVNFEWIPHQLTPALRAQRVATAEKLLEFFDNASEATLNRVYTEDETWIYFDNPRTSMWVLNGSPKPTKPRQNIASKKCMIAVFWSRKGIASITKLPEDKTFNREFFLDNAFHEFIHTNNINNIIVHFDNARPHLIDDFLNTYKIRRLPHPPYSPDLAPSDFFLFGYLKMKLEGCVFNNPRELFQTVTKILRDIPKDYFIKAYDEWIQRLHEVKNNGGEYL